MIGASFKGFRQGQESITAINLEIQCELDQYCYLIIFSFVNNPSDRETFKGSFIDDVTTQVREGGSHFGDAMYEVLSKAPFYE